MKARTSTAISILLLVLLLMLSAGCAGPPLYSAEEIRGRVVDEKSGEPVEGAIVVAEWILFHIGPGDHGRRLKVVETVTDAQGNYVISAWGPRVRPPMTRLLHQDPQISVFKRGYQPTEVRNANFGDAAVRRSDWDGKPIQLTPIAETESLEKYSSRLNLFYDGLVEDMGNQQEWRQYPLMTRAVYEEYKRINATGARVFRPSIPLNGEFVEL